MVVVIVRQRNSVQDWFQSAQSELDRGIVTVTMTNSEPDSYLPATGLIAIEKLKLSAPDWYK